MKGKTKELIHMAVQEMMDGQPHIIIAVHSMDYARTLFRDMIRKMKKAGMVPKAYNQRMVIRWNGSQIGFTSARQPPEPLLGFNGSIYVDHYAAVKFQNFAKFVEHYPCRTSQRTTSEP